MTDTTLPETYAPRRRTFAQQFQGALPLYLMMVPTFVLLLVFMYYPALSAIYYSFFYWNGFTPPEFAGLGNFQQLFQDPVIRDSISNLAMLTLAALLIVITMPLFAAEFIFHLRSERAQFWYRVLFVIPIVVPGVATLLIWKYIFQPTDGLLNVLLANLGLYAWRGTWLGDPDRALLSVILIGFPWIAGFNLLIYLAGLQSIPQEILDAAAVDGTTGLGRFFHIDLPLISGQIKLLVILTIINSLQRFVDIQILTNGGPGYSTMVPGIVMYQSAFQNSSFGYGMAIGTATFAVIFVLTYINLRYIRSSTEYQA